MVRVRPFAEKDRAAVEAIYRECRAEATWLPAAVKERSGRALDLRGESLLVAVDGNDEAEGFVSVWEPEAFIHHLYVRRESRQRGIGAALLDSLGTRLPKPWRLKCLRANVRALAFYLGRGWMETSSGDGEDGPFAVLEKREADPLPRFAEHVVLRRLAASDLPVFQAYRNDPLVARFQGWAARSDAEASAYLTEMSAATLLQPGRWSQIGIADPDGLGLLGDIGLFLARDGREAEIGFTLKRDSQGRGIGVAAVREAIDLVFEQTKAGRVVGITDERNLRSIRLLQRVGMHMTGSRGAICRDQPCVEHIYAILRKT